MNFLEIKITLCTFAQLDIQYIPIKRNYKGPIEFYAHATEGIKMDSLLKWQLVRIDMGAAIGELFEKMKLLGLSFQCIQYTGNCPLNLNKHAAKASLISNHSCPTDFLQVNNSICRESLLRVTLGPTVRISFFIYIILKRKKVRTPL